MFSSPAVNHETQKDAIKIDNTYINQLLSRRTRYIPIPNPITQNRDIIAQLSARTGSA